MADGTSLIEVMFGSQTFRNGSSKVNAYCFKEDGMRTFPSNILKKHGSSEKFYAARDNYADHGEWFKHRLVAEEGTLLMVTLSVTYNGSPYADAAVAIRLRPDAPLIQVKGSLNQDRDAAFESMVLFLGNGDVIDADEARLLGAQINQGFENRYMDPEEVEEIIEVQTVMDGKTDKPQVTKVRNRDGEERGVVVPKGAKRRIRVRRS